MAINQRIADFADSIFDGSWAFEKTTLRNASVMDHEGMFVVLPEQVGTYVERYRPLCLRHGASSATHLSLPFVNFGMAKGRSVERVLIAPTAPMIAFMRKKKSLDDLPAFSFLRRGHTCACARSNC